MGRYYHCTCRTGCPESAGKLINVLVLAMAMVVRLMRARQDEFLSAHNDEWASVGIAGLVWDDKVASYAQRYGEQQRDQANYELAHSGGPYGKNLFLTSASVSPTDAVNAWIS